MLPLGLKLRVLHDAEAPAAGDDCYGFVALSGIAVYDQDGRVGTVRHVRFGQTPAQQDALVVRTGLFIRRLMLITTDEIDEISTDHHRVLLRTQPGREVARTRRRGAAQRPRLGGTW